MAQQLLDKASYSLVRTNPKLTGNVKVVSDGTDIYLESFSANTRLSSQKFKAFKIYWSFSEEKIDGAEFGRIDSASVQLSKTLLSITS